LRSNKEITFKKGGKSHFVDKYEFYLL